MEAVVEIINLEDRLAGARIGPAEYLVFELLNGCRPRVGDVIRHHNFYDMNYRHYRDVTQARTMEVCVRSVVGSVRKLREACHLKPER